jgi:protein SCO1/2
VLRKLRFALWGLVAAAVIAAGGLAAWSLRTPQAPETTATLAGAPLGGAFTLTDHEGQTATEAVFRGLPSVTFFGFTHCPDVCPTTLMEMAGWAEALGGDANRLRFIFVTVDPERDTPEVMRDYAAAFSPRIVGITGEPAAVQAMLRDYKIFSRRVPLEDGDYTMEHTASVILQDAEGNFVGTIDASESRETAIAKLRRLVDG